MKKNRLTLFLLLFSSVLAAQKLSLDDAIAIGLKNNYDILIENNLAASAANNNTAGNAGMLPKIDLNAATSFANNATRQEFASGLTVDQTGVRSSSTTTGVYLTWTLFDGMRMFAAKGRLNALEDLASESVKLKIESTVAQIINSYFDVVRQQLLLSGLNENIKYSEERIRIAQMRLDVGNGSRLDVMQAKVDMNAQSSQLIRERTALRTLKGNLNVLLARAAETEFEVSDSIPSSMQMSYEELRSGLQNNRELLYAQRMMSVYRQLIKEEQAAYYPRLNLNANYLFSRSESAAGFSLLNQNLGLNMGLTASWTIFNGMNTRNRVKNARLELESADYSYRATSLQLQQRLLDAYRKYEDDREVQTLEEENLQLAKEVIDIALERFRIGASNSLELKEAQRSYQEALIRLAEARYATKVTETNLLQINGKLLK
jgi:outer membrane protein TolC